MALIVQKYGGSSVSDAASVRRVAKRIVDTKRAGNDVVVVVSAMGDSTDELLELAHEVSPDPPGRELDMLLTAGERISMAVLAMAIHDLGEEGRSHTGSQAGLITDSAHGAARIIDVTPRRILHAIDDGAIPIVAGFQGVSLESKDITTLGRGGSDTTAVALAVALSADVCEIFTDVDGVFSTDPRVVPAARRVPRISYEEMLELAAAGAKVLHVRCVEYARRANLPIHVRSSFSDREGTWVVNANDPLPAAANPAEGATVEQPIIAGVALDLNDCKITAIGVPDRPGEAAQIFRAVAEAGVNVDMIVQNVSYDGSTDISFTVPSASVEMARAEAEAVATSVGAGGVSIDPTIGKVSVVGIGMKTESGIAAKMFRILSDNGVNIQMISTSPIRISCVVDEELVEKAVEVLHDGLDVGQEAGA